MAAEEIAVKKYVVRLFAIACGWPYVDDLDDLRKDPAIRLTCGRAPGFFQPGFQTVEHIPGDNSQLYRRRK